MKNNTTGREAKEAKEIIGSIQGFIKEYLRKSNKTQVELYIALHIAETSVRSRRAKQMLQVLLEIMHKEVGGYPNPPQSEDTANIYGILSAEVIL